MSIYLQPLYGPFCIGFALSPGHYLNKAKLQSRWKRSLPPSPLTHSRSALSPGASSSGHHLCVPEVFSACGLSVHPPSGTEPTQINETISDFKELRTEDIAQDLVTLQEMAMLKAWTQFGLSWGENANFIYLNKDPQSLVCNPWHWICFRIQSLSDFRKIRWHLYSFNCQRRLD